MNTADLHFFTDSTLNYFQAMSNEKAYAGIPYIKDGKPVVLEYTGIVGISVNIKGCIYLTTTGDMLRELAQIIIDTEKISKEDIKDLVGEIANKISGNVREAYGSALLDIEHRMRKVNNYSKLSVMRNKIKHELKIENKEVA